MNKDVVGPYLESTAGRLAADGCQVRTEDWNGATVTMGYRADFRIQWMATKLHLFTVMAAFPEIRQSDIEGFTNTVLGYVHRYKGQLRGLQSGIATFPCLVGTRVDPAALAWAQDRQRVRFALMARPVVVDLSTGTTACFRGTTTLGIVYSRHLRQKLASYFPESPRAATG